MGGRVETEREKRKEIESYTQSTIHSITGPEPQNMLHFSATSLSHLIRQVFLRAKMRSQRTKGNCLPPTDWVKKKEAKTPLKVCPCPYLQPASGGQSRRGGQKRSKWAESRRSKTRIGRSFVPDTVTRQRILATDQQVLQHARRLLQRTMNGHPRPLIALRQQVHEARSVGAWMAHTGRPRGFGRTANRATGLLVDDPRWTNAYGRPFLCPFSNEWTALVSQSSGGTRCASLAGQSAGWSDTIGLILLEKLDQCRLRFYWSSLFPFPLLKNKKHPVKFDANICRLPSWLCCKAFYGRQFKTHNSENE